MASGRVLRTERGDLRLADSQRRALHAAELLDAARALAAGAGLAEQAPVLTGEAGLFELGVEDLREVMVYRPVASRGRPTGDWRLARFFWSKISRVLPRPTASPISRRGRRLDSMVRAGRSW